MLARFSLSLLFLLTLPFYAPAQNVALGHMRIVIATAMEGNVTVLWDGEDVQPGGYASGTVTGVVSFPAGVHQLRVKHDTLGEATFAVQLMPEAGNNFIIYAEAAAQKTEGGTKKSQFKLAKLDMVPGKKSRSLCFFALPTAQDVKAAAGDHQVVLKPLEAMRHDFKGGARNAFEILLNSVKTTYVRFDADAGEQVIICYADPAGTIKALKFDNAFD